MEQVAITSVGVEHRDTFFNIFNFSLSIVEILNFLNNFLTLFDIFNKILAIVKISFYPLKIYEKSKGKKFIFF
jgi:hypothetical protein